jgi:hypothetical protein
LLLLLWLRFLAQFCWSPPRKGGGCCLERRKGAVLRAQLAFIGRDERSVRSLLRLKATHGHE